MKSYIEKANQYIAENQHIVNDIYRHKYHLMGPLGWINDPNGFSIYNDEFHLFFQYHPYSAKWGPMHWGHATSKDLIHWEHKHTALGPIGDGIEGGAPFSGCAISQGDKHILMYTENWPKRQVQSIAVSSDGITYIPYENNPVISSNHLPKGAKKEDFRDPKIWKKGDMFYAIISSRANDLSGQILLYKSNDLFEWEYVNSICQSNNKLGKMWECPDLFSCEDKDILIVSPQFMEKQEDRFSNVHASLYMIGKLDDIKEKYTYETFDEIDHGFDFYAPQTILDKQNRRIMIAWMGMWERNMPTDDLKHNWAGAMTLPRILELRDNKIIQRPIDEMINYRLNEDSLHEIIKGEKQTHIKGKVLEITLEIENIDAKQFGIKLFKSENEETVITYDVITSKVIFDRTRSGYLIQGNTAKEDNSNIRKTNVDLRNNTLKLHIFLDKSSIEVFIQDGLRTMTALVYPKEHSEGISLFSSGGYAKFDLKKWNIKR
jgi:beta-fructofuranosidase